MATVSALIPTYNRDDHIRGAIQTVLRQSYDDIEAVVVNDGSTDRTKNVLDEFRDHERVRVLHNDRNRGIAYSFNRAADAATGEFYCILGDDDRWHPSKVERQLDLMRSLPAEYGIVYTGGVATRDGRIVREYRPSVAGDIYPEILATFPLTPHSSHMLRRDAFQSVDGFDTDFPHGVDWDMNIRLARDWKYAFLDDPLVNRRLHDDNVSIGTIARAEDYERIHQKFAAEIADYPSIETEFFDRLRRNKAQAAIEAGNRLAALKHGVSVLRHDPAVPTVGLVVVSALGPSAYRLARRVRNRMNDGPERDDAFLEIARRWWVRELGELKAEGASTT